MLFRLCFFFPFLISFPLFSIFVGNPQSPSLYPEGIIFTETERWSFHVGYLYDIIYKGRYEEKNRSLLSLPSETKLQTRAALGTLSVNKRLDIYGILGNSQLQFNDVDDIILSPNCLCYGGGVRILFWQKKELGFGGDVKYFRTNQRPHYILSDKQLAPLVTKLEMQYEEIQLAVALSYQFERFVPYGGITYLYSTIEPNAREGLIRMSGVPYLVDFIIKATQTRKNWGMFLGTSLISYKSIALNIETRFFDQNGWNISGEIRF